MESAKNLPLVATASLAIFLSGCFEEKMPEVNDTNCKPENIKKLDSRAMQQEFSSKCLRRGTFKKSSGEGFTVK